MTSQPCNGKSFVQTQAKSWTSQWSVILRAFYRQILSKLPPPARPGTTCTGIFVLSHLSSSECYLATDSRSRNWLTYQSLSFQFGRYNSWTFLDPSLPRGTGSSNFSMSRYQIRWQIYFISWGEGKRAFPPSPFTGRFLSTSGGTGGNHH